MDAAFSRCVAVVLPYTSYVPHIAKTNLWKKKSSWCWHRVIYGITSSSVRLKYYDEGGQRQYSIGQSRRTYVLRRVRVKAAGIVFFFTCLWRLHTMFQTKSNYSGIYIFWLRNWVFSPAISGFLGGTVKHTSRLRRMLRAVFPRAFWKWYLFLESCSLNVHVVSSWDMSIFNQNQQ